MVYEIKRLHLHNIMINLKAKTIKKDHVHKFLLKNWNLTDNSISNLLLIDISRNFFPHYFNKWEKCYRVNERFIKKEHKWLNECYRFQTNDSRLNMMQGFKIITFFYNLFVCFFLFFNLL